MSEDLSVCPSGTWARYEKSRALCLKSPEPACCPSFQVLLLK